MSETRQISTMRRLKGFMLRHMHGMITCQQFEDFILAYLEGELPARQRRLFEWHIRLCRECREYLQAYRRSIETGQRVFADPDEALPQDVPEDLVRAIVAARE